ncbi:3508_t:CDS:2, partial [Gigaspora margarita]
NNYQPDKIRLDVAIKKLFQKKKQEIVRSLEKFKNRVLKKDKTVTKYLGIQHVELICIIRETIKEYDYIQHKIAQGYECGTYDYGMKELQATINEDKKVANKVEVLQDSLQSMSIQEENKKSYPMKVDYLTHDKAREDILVSRWAPRNRVKFTSTNQTQVIQKITTMTNQSCSRQKPATIITIWDLPEDARVQKI